MQKMTAATMIPAVAPMESFEDLGGGGTIVRVWVVSFMERMGTRFWRAFSRKVLCETEKVERS